jgi:hypothetical protein
MKSDARFTLTLIVFLLFAALPAPAHEYPLSARAIRDAYFLGKASAGKRAEFLAKYTQQLPMPKTGPHVSRIRLETPYAVVVERTSQTLSNYFAADAEKEFLGKPAVFRLHVQIDLTSSYAWQISAGPAGVQLRPDDFWRDFAIRLVQNAALEPRAIRGQPIYSFSGSGGVSVLLGAEVNLEYDAAEIQSAPATVEVDTPDGQHVQTTFDLAKLR